jgi:hypothetical protein
MFLLADVFYTERAYSATRLGLHTTLEELNIWKGRANGTITGSINGFTYQSIYTNRILADANIFLGQAPAARDGAWAGYTAPGCVSGTDVTVTPGKGGTPWEYGNGAYMLRSAFNFLLTGDTSYAAPVATVLLNQITVPGTDWANSSKWCSAQLGGTNAIQIVPWIVRLLIAYDYLNAGGYTGFSPTDKANITTWFVNAANVWQASLTNKVSCCMSYTGIFAIPQDLTAPAAGGAQSLYFNGPNADQATFNTFYNQPLNNVILVMGVGVMTNNTAMIQWASAYFTAFVKAGTFNNGAVADFRRWNDCTPGCPGSMWGHTAGAMGPMVATADMLARTGNTSLYALAAPTQVIGGSPGTVSLGLTLKLWAKMANKTTLFYGTTDGAQLNNDRLLSWDSEKDFGTPGEYTDFPSMVANIYYNDSDIHTAMTRTSINGNTTSGCRDASQGGCFTGVASAWADLPFMFGNMEGLVNPYSVAASTAPAITITAPTSAATYTTATSPLTPNLAGTATDDVGVLSVTWACSTCTPTSGTATCASCGAAGTSVSWSVATIGLAIGDNVITVTATDADTQTSTDVLTVTRTGQIACYSFDNVGTDTTGRGHTMVLTGGATYGAGQVNQALLLDGINDYASTPTATDLNLTGDMTVDFFANLVSVGNNVHLVSKEDLSAPNATPYHVKINNGGIPNYQFYQHGGGDFSTILNFTSFTVPTNTWHHVAITRNLATGQITLWINGVSTQTLTGWTDPPAANTIPLTLGSSTVQGAGTFLSGRLDEVCLSNYVLSTAEIQARAARATAAVAAPTLLRLVK